MVKIPVDWFLVDVWPMFNGLAEYARILEDQIDRLTNAERLRIQRTPFPDEAEWQNTWREHRWLFEETLPRTLRYSCIVSLVIALETTLNDACKELQKRRDHGLSVKDLRGRGLDRALLYFTKVIGLDTDAYQFTSKVHDLKILRNCIVHTSGYMANSKDERKIREILRRTNDFSISPDGYLEIKKGACESAIRGTQDWILKILVAAGFRYESPRSD